MYQDLFVIEAEVEKKCVAYAGGVGSDDKFNAVPLVCPMAQQCDCATWSPESHVIEVGSISYQVEQLLIDEMALHPSVLSYCDTSRFTNAAGTQGLVVRNAKEGDLVYLLGLRSGDEIVSLNRYPIENWQASVGLYAYFSWIGETDFDLVVDRDGQPLEFHYEIVP